MPSHRVDAVSVPKLLKKLGILYFYSRNINSDDALGRILGIQGRSIRHWVYGEGLRADNSVPADRFGPLVEVFRKQLPGRRTDDEVRAILLSHRVDDLFTAFQCTGPEIDWVSRMLDAPRASASIVSAYPSISMEITRRNVETQLADISGTVEFPTQVDFYIQLDTPLCGWLAILQWGSSGCFGMELGDGVAVVQLRNDVMKFPSAEPYFCEQELGIRHYIFLQSKVPFPVDLVSKLTISSRTPAALDVNVLDRLGHLSGNEHGMEVTSLPVRFVEEDE